MANFELFEKETD